MWKLGGQQSGPESSAATGNKRGSVRVSTRDLQVKPSSWGSVLTWGSKDHGESVRRWGGEIVRVARQQCEPESECTDG